MVSQRRKMNCILSASCFLSCIFSLYILLLCSCRVDCYARDTLKHGERITNDGGTLVSIGGTFELGFFITSSHKRFVGIWYKQDQPTVVWVANRDSPLNGSIGTFGIAEDGNLKVWDTTGNVYWSSTTGVENYSSTNRTVKLMDSGNLVLSDDLLATSLWQSFQNPTDTFLPGMKMDEALWLTSWTGDGDPGTGQFTFKQDLEGEGYYVILKKHDDYWRSQTPGKFMSSDEMPYAIAYLLSNFSNTKYPLPLLDYNYTRLVMNYTDYNYTRLVMKYNGELQYLKWDVDKGIWSLIWWGPEDKCSIYNACGKFGSCNINNRLECKCLPGFQPTYPEKWKSGDFLGGCTRNSTSSDKGDMFLSLKMMKVSYAESNFVVKNETECRKECLNNSQCQAYSYEAAQSQNSNLRSDSTTTGTDDICYIWVGDLSNLQEEYTNGGRNLSVRVAKSVIEPTISNCEPCGTNLIPYPLSTGPNCGDPMYFSFYCNSSTGQVSFKTPNSTYRVESIDPSTGTFVIKVNDAENPESRSPRGTLLLNYTLPFNTPGWFTADEVKISWEPPLEPTCSLLTDCKDWPNSTCNITRDGKRRCLCKQNFRWNGSTLHCTQEGNIPLSFEEPLKRKKRLPVSVVVPLTIVFALTCSISCVYV